MKTVDSGQWTVDRVQGPGFSIHYSAFCVLRSAFCVHPSSFIPHPSAPRLSPLAPRPSHRGISLIEVLVSIAILAVGLLGVAAIIPLGQIALWETAKADRAGACGRAALRQIQVRRMLDFRYWYWTPIPPTPLSNYWGFYPTYNPSNYIQDNYATVSASFDSLPFIIDPLGRAKGLPETFGSISAVLPRRTLRVAPLSPNYVQPTLINADSFFWSDDLPFDIPKDATARPSLISSTSEGNYSWFYTVTPAASEARIDYTTTPPTVVPLPIDQRRLFNVSVAVCYKRNFDPAAIDTAEGEHTATINSNNVTPPGFPGMGIGGGVVQIIVPSEPYFTVNENQWVMLYHLDVNPILHRCYWYRVLSVGRMPDNTDPTKEQVNIALAGPDWDPNLDATLIVVPGVIGVYTTTMELDNDLLR